MTKVYLAGRNTGLSMEVCLAWRLQAQENFAKYGISCHLPVDVDWAKYTPAELVLKDLVSIDSCDGILVDIREPSWGTAMEIFWASRNKKPTIPIVGWRLSEQTDHLSPWLVCHINNEIKGLGPACDFLAKMLTDGF